MGQRIWRLWIDGPYFEVIWARACAESDASKEEHEPLYILRHKCSESDGSTFRENVCNDQEKKERKRESRALSFSLKHKRADLEIIRRWSFILPLKTLLALKWSHAHTKFSDYSVQ